MKDLFKMKPTLSSFLSQIEKDKSHRFTSWEHCYQAFQTETDKELLTLHLAFYLASWGMYRGSSGLLQKNHTIHRETVNIILKYKYLQCSQNKEIGLNDLEDIINLINELKKHYLSITYIKDNEEKNINPTDTLISKVILGSLGCLPAMDRYFINGVKDKNETFFTLSKPSLSKLFLYINQKQVKTEIESLQQEILESRKMYYPTMKIIDMYFWQLGYEKV